MTRNQTLTRILSDKVVAIIRMKNPKHISQTVAALIEGGINALEITSNTPDFASHIEQSRLKHQNALIGAGTIISTSLAKQAIDSGAQFLVTPNTDPQIVEIASRADVPVIMGAFTATEMQVASQAGADIIKLFPASIAGIAYMKSVLAPLDHLKLFAVGGINAENAKSWLEAGAAGIGVGSQLTVIQPDGTIDVQATVTNIQSLLTAIEF